MKKIFKYKMNGQEVKRKIFPAVKLPKNAQASEGVLVRQARSIGHPAVFSMLEKTDEWQDGRAAVAYFLGYFLKKREEGVCGQHDRFN